MAISTLRSWRRIRSVRAPSSTTPAGHVGIVYKVEANGRIHFFDSHTDYSLTETVYDLRFAREKPAVGAGFKNWRPQRLEGGRVVLAGNAQIADFSESSSPATARGRATRIGRAARSR